MAGAVSALGGLDVLVNNVGVARIRTFEQVDDEEWQAAWDTNVMSYVRCIRAALPDLRRLSSRRIVNVASTSGKRPSAGMPEYSVTKAALLSLSRLVADVYAGDGIRCNAVCSRPDAARRRGWRPAAWPTRPPPSPAADRDEVLERWPARPAAEADGRARGDRGVIAFLCSPQSAYVTGAAWSADGGTVPVIL